MAPTRRSALQLVVVAALSLAEGRSPTLPFSGKSSAVLRLRAGSTAQGPDNTFVTAEEAADASSTASSADVTSVDAATRHWLATVTSGKPDAPEATSALYAPDAKLWGTVSDELRYTGKDIRAYFDYFARVPGLALVPGSYKTSITIDGDVAVASGYYSFVLPGADGKPSNVPARFTFVFRRRRRASILPALEAEKRAAVEAQDYEKADAIKTQIAAALQEPTRPGWDIVAHHSSKVPAQPKYLKGVPQAAPPQPSPYVPAAHGYPTTNAALSREELPPVKCNEDAARIAYETHKQEISAARAAHDSARFTKMQAPSSSSSSASSASPRPAPAEDYWTQTRKAKQQPSGPPPAAPAPASQAVSTATSSSPVVDQSNGLSQFLRDLRKLAVVALVGVTLVSPQPGLPRFGGNQKVVENEKDKGKGGVSLIKAAAGVIVGLAGLGWLL